MKHFRLLLAVILSAGTLFAGEIVRTREAPASEIGLPASVTVGDSFRLKLFDDVEMTLAIVAKPPAGIAGQSFIAKDDSGSASAIVKFSGDTARISIDDFMNRRQYTVRVKNGTATITERDNSQMEDGECGTCGGDIEVPQPAVEETKTTATKKSRTLLGASGNEFTLAEQKSVVDILVAFDKGAKEWAENGSNWDNGGDSIEEFADYAVNKMNTVLQNSQLDDKFCYRLVGVTEVDDSWTTINKELLGAMRTREGKFAKLSQLRERCGADTITLLINRGSGTTSGIGFEYGTNNNTKAIYTPSQFDGMNYACNICDINTVYSRYTMSHETGHNMGCGHSNRQGSDSGPGRYSYSCGYHFEDQNKVKRYTVMAYDHTSPASGTYMPVPYFSTPGISPDEYGCALGVEGVNDNCQTLENTHADIASLREHVMPYDWDVKFLDDNGNEIPDGAYFYGSTYVTLTNANPEAEIYYTLDGSTPNKNTTTHGASGSKVYVYLTNGSKTLTACAVVDGVAQSVRSITLHDGLTWSGDENGNGIWMSDSSKTPWNGEYFCNGDAVKFDDLAGVASATVTVKGAVAPSSVSFSAVNTAYTFDKGDDDANISIPDASFAPAGDVTFNLPVQLAAKTFTSMTGCALTFNAPFGQTVGAANGNCTNMISISHGSTFTVAPGMGNTQTFGRFNTSAPSTATFRAGTGNIVFNGPYDGGNGVFGDAQVIIGEGANVTFNCAAATGFNKTSPFTIEKGATVSFNGNMEHMRRPLYLNGGTITASARFDRMRAAGITVNDDSVIVGNGYMLIRYADEQINVVDGKTLTLNIPTQDGSNTSGWGIIKRGAGTLEANAELKHSGKTIVSNGIFTVGYSSGSSAYGQGWIVASNSTLRVKSGCSLKVPSLTLDPTSIISLPVATSAPLDVNGNVDLTDVRISIQDGGDLSLGASYPLISATGNISGIKSLVRESWPKLGTGLGWKIAVSGGVLTASIVNAAEADIWLDFMTNIPGLTPSIPEDATMSADGGLKIGSLPIVIDGLTTNAVGVTLDVTIGEPTEAERTICSWVVDGNIARCVVTNGVIDCFYANNGHVKNSVPFLELSPGRHVINVGYKSLNDTTYGGTFVYVDGTLAYRAAGLRWSDKSVAKFTVGATAGDTPDKLYTDLIVHNFALLNESSTIPLPNMSSSGGTISYDYFAGKPPCVFALTSDGGFETYSAILSGAFSGTYDALSVSIVASFPENATGAIISSAVADGNFARSTQVEYRGNGVLAFREDGSSSLIASVQVDADMSAKHLYTMTYTNGVGYKLYIDGTEVLANDGYYAGKNMPLINRVVFGCGYWTNLMISYNANPNPISNLKVYASHIALGTNDRTESEAAVKEATGYEPADTEEEDLDPELPATPATIDILVGYDNGAQTYVANKSMTLEAFAQEQIKKMNDVLVTNKLDRFYSYRLAGVCKVDGTYGDINSAPQLAAAGVDAAVSLRAARELYGADTVTLLVDTSGAIIGNSSPLSSSSDVASQHECAFSVCSIRAVDTGKQHTMIHENAHNMGCGHARAQDPNICSPFAYGRGFYFKDGNMTRHTIMAYGGDNDASWYFSTTSKEFGFALGDKTNNNARVLKETCGEVAKWRTSVVPDADDVRVFDESGNEILSDCFFNDSLKVTAVAPVEGAELYYTFDGSEPTLNGDTWHQTSPFTFNFTVNRTLKIAYKSGETLSPVRTIRFTKTAKVPADGLWQTCLKYPWTVEGDTIRSFNQTDYKYQCTTPLKATIAGPKRLSFSHKSYFGGITVAGEGNYSHFDVLVDDSPVFTQTECTNEWETAAIDIPNGTHEVTFVFSQRFAMNNPSDNKDLTSDADDAVWLKDIALEDVQTLECKHSSTSDDVDWVFPYDYEATAIDGNLGGIEVGSKGVVETLNFSTNAVVLSILAELPENEKGEIAGCKIYRASSGAYFYAFAYSNGDGTFSLGHGTTTNHVTSIAYSVSDWNGLHVWTFAFGAQTGAALYCDGVKVTGSDDIKWANTVISDRATFGDDPRTGWALTGAKIYAAHSDFGNDAFVSVTNNPASAVSDMLKAVSGGNEFVDEILEMQLALLTVYKELGYIPEKSDKADSSVLRISEIMPKPTDALNRGALEGMDVNGLESGWVEVENTSPDKWADLGDYKFIRSNRGKKTGQADYDTFPSVMIAPGSRYVFYTSERYSNSADMSVSAWAEADENGIKPKLYGADLKGILVWPDKVNPKKSPFVRLIYTPTDAIVDTVVVPSDVPEGCSIIVGEAGDGEATKRWLCPTPTRGRANTATEGLVRIGPNAGPLYEIAGGKKHNSANEFARLAPPAVPGEDYEITFSFNPVMHPTVAGGFRDEDAITDIRLVYRTDLTNATTIASVDMTTDNFDAKDWGHTYTATIPHAVFDTIGAGHLIQWKFIAADASGNEWTSPSFNNPDDGYEWYGTIVEVPELESATLPTWHMFVDDASRAQMDYDKDDSRYTLPNGARIAIYDSSTSNYYDYVRIDLRGNTSKNFTKKGHGLRFAKAHPLTMVDSVTGETIEEIRKTSLISEFADPSYMRQMIAFWLWKKMGNLVPFDFPVRCNLNGEFYQLAFNSERFTDELIEDVYGLDKFGYSWKNVGTLKSESKTTAGSIEKKTPDDEDESNVTVLESELRSKLKEYGAQEAGEDTAELTKFVVQKFNLPAWINYLASARITQEMDDVWANVCIYYDNPDMKEGARGTGTWMPLGYDFNLSFGQYYYADIKDYGNSRDGLMATNDWYKSHPFYGGNKVVAYRNSSNMGEMNGNDGFEAVYQSSKFRRLYLRRLRTLMDQELKSPGTAEGATPFMMKMRKMAGLMRADATLDQKQWPNNDTDSAIDVWTTRPADMDAGIDDIWNNYVVPRREHLYVTHSVTNTAKEIGYGSDLNAGIPEAQSPFDELIAKITINTNDCASGVVIISNNNDEVVDMSGWRLVTGSGKKDFWELPAGTVCDSNDCIYVVSDRRKYIADHESELTDQIIVGNATFGDFKVEPTFDENKTAAIEGVSLEDTGVVFSAADEAAAKAWADSVSPALTQEDADAGLETQYLKVVAEPVEGSPGKYKAAIVVNPATVEAPIVAEPAAESEPVKIEEDDKGETTVSVSISNAFQGLWYGYEVSDALGEAANFANDVDSFKRATESAHTVKGSPRDKASGFFRIKVLPAKPSH